ncbi:MAG: hypothetical protein ACOYD0_08450 [Candidatus Nanopelagicales bacterium]
MTKTIDFELPDIDLPTPAEAAEVVADKLETVGAATTAAAVEAIDALEEGLAAATEAVQPAADDASNWISAHPLAAVTIAFAAGVVLTSILSRRRGKRSQAE